MQNIELPDGKIAEFPDEMPLEQIKSVIRTKFPPQDKQSQPGFLERSANDVEHYINKPIESIGRGARDIAGGFGQGIANIAPGLYNLAVSGVNALGAHAPKSPMLDMVPHTPSATAGEIGSFFAPGGLLKLLGKVPGAASTVNHAMKIPILANAIKHSSNILSKSPVASGLAGNAIMGGAYNPDNPLLGLGLGAAGGVLGLGVSKGYSGIKNSLANNEFVQKNLAKINPLAQSKDIEHHLSGGSNNITENSRNLVNDIRNAYKMREEEAGIFFNHALDKAGHEEIYHPGSMILNQPSEGIKTIEKIKGLGVGDLYGVFKAKPTFQNAQNLRAEMGSMIGELKANPLKTQDDKFQLRKLKDARTQLTHDIFKFLGKRDAISNQSLLPSYKRGIDLYRENVAPFHSDKKLIDIVKNGKTDIKNIHSVFNTPTNKINKKGLEEIGPINKILQDLPESSKNKILFSAIGGNKNTPNELLESLLKVKSKGYGSYITPETDEMINALTKKIINKNIALKGSALAGIGTTAALGQNALSHLAGH